MKFKYKISKISYINKLVKGYTKFKNFNYDIIDIKHRGGNSKKLVLLECVHI